MKVMLAANVCIAGMRGQEKAVARLASLAPGDCAVSVVAVYELLTGVAKAGSHCAPHRLFEAMPCFLPGRVSFRPRRPHRLCGDFENATADGPEEHGKFL